MGQIHISSCFSVFCYVVNFCSVILNPPKSIVKKKILRWSKIKHVVKIVALKLRPWTLKTLFLLFYFLIITSVNPQKPSAYFAWKSWTHSWLYSLNHPLIQKTTLIFFAKHSCGAIICPQRRHSVGSSSSQELLSCSPHFAPKYSSLWNKNSAEAGKALHSRYPQ